MYELKQDDAAGGTSSIILTEVHDKGASEPLINLHLTESHWTAIASGNGHNLMLTRGQASELATRLQFFADHGSLPKEKPVSGPFTFPDGPAVPKEVTWVNPPAPEEATWRGTANPPALLDAFIATEPDEKLVKLDILALSELDKLCDDAPHGTYLDSDGDCAVCGEWVPPKEEEEDCEWHNICHEEEEENSDPFRYDPTALYAVMRGALLYAVADCEIVAEKLAEDARDEQNRGLEEAVVIIPIKANNPVIE
jgi:hypothetical protein